MVNGGGSSFSNTSKPNMDCSVQQMLNGISKQKEVFYDDRQNFWFFANSGVDKEVYDRTYYNTKGKKLGYFYYVDAANLPGRLVKIPLDQGTICANTGL